MFRPMRRKKQLLPEVETIGMLQSCTSGVLAVHGDDDYAYAVPLSFAYEDGKLFFHAAVAGHKLDALARPDVPRREVLTRLPRRGGLRDRRRLEESVRDRARRRAHDRQSFAGARQEARVDDVGRRQTAPRHR